jgi:hypothetical protein
VELRLLVACGIALLAGAGSAQAAVRLSVTPSSALVNEPVDVRVAGLRPHKPVILRARTADRYGNRWESSLALNASRNGTADTHSYMRLFWSMQPTKPLPLAQRMFATADGPTPVKISAIVGGRVVASGTLQRSRIAADLVTGERGGTAEANEQAAANGWPQILDFLATLPG